MKLLIIAAIAGFCAAARLEHLERGYLPPDQGHQGQSSFGQNNGGFGSASSRSGFHGGSNELSQGSAGGSLSAAQLTKYLPPDHGPSGGNSGSSFQSRFGSQGSAGGFARASSQSNDFSGLNQQYGAPQQQYNAPQQQYGAPAQSGSNQYQSRYNTPSQQYGGRSGSNQVQSRFNSQYQQQDEGQFGSAQSRQYLAPHQSSNSQNIPQQAFDEQTGYHY